MNGICRKSNLAERLGTVRGGEKIIHAADLLRERARNELYSIPLAVIKRQASHISTAGEYRQPFFGRSCSGLNEGTFTSIGIETAGGENERIIELAAIRFEHGVPVQMFHTMLNPGFSLACGESEEKHVYNSTLSSAPKAYQIIDSFDKFVGHSRVVGYELDKAVKLLGEAGSSIWVQDGEFTDVARNYGARVRGKKKERGITLKEACREDAVPFVCDNSAPVNAWCAGKLALEIAKREKNRLAQ